MKQASMAAFKLTMRLYSTVAPNAAARLFARKFATPRRFPEKPQETEWMRTARSRRLPFDGANSLAVYEWGDGPVIVLLHGYEGRAAQLGGFARPLVESGYRVVAFDAPAHGTSDGQRSTVQEMAKALDAVARDVGPVDAIIAHSLGTTALVYCLEKGLHCEKAILISPPAQPDTFLTGIARFIGVRPRAAGRAQRLLEEEFGAPFEAFRPLLAVPTLSQKALVIHDASDRQVLIRDGEEIARNWPGAEFEMTDGLGHTRLLRDPGVVARTLAFLQRP